MTGVDVMTERKIIHLDLDAFFSRLYPFM